MDAGPWDRSGSAQDGEGGGTRRQARRDALLEAGMWTQHQQGKDEASARRPVSSSYHAIHCRRARVTPRLSIRRTSVAIRASFSARPRQTSAHERHARPTACDRMYRADGGSTLTSMISSPRRDRKRLCKWTLAVYSAAARCGAAPATRRHRRGGRFGSGARRKTRSGKAVARSRTESPGGRLDRAWSATRP